MLKTVQAESGDYIPFRQQNYNAVRFTSANEHGDANPVAGYQDRQHSTRDILGKDYNNDNVIDSYYVSTSYLQRNCFLNGTILPWLLMAQLCLNLVLTT
jgi:hypothetical protein